PCGGRVDLSVKLAQETVTLQVKDSGPGITADEQMRVFDPFYRSVGTEEAGSGLGLSIVKAIAERTGARLHLGFSNETDKSGLCVAIGLPRGSR
ncbi:MAG: sensor histidine kinase, partial [Pseudomonas sp.]